MGLLRRRLDHLQARQVDDRAAHGICVRVALVYLLIQLFMHRCQDSQFRFDEFYLVNGQGPIYRMAVPEPREPRPDGEIVECRWFPPAELDDVSVKPTNLELLRLHSEKIESGGASQAISWPPADPARHRLP